MVFRRAWNKHWAAVLLVYYTCLSFHSNLISGCRPSFHSIRTLFVVRCFMWTSHCCWLFDVFYQSYETIFVLLLKVSFNKTCLITNNLCPNLSDISQLNNWLPKSDIIYPLEIGYLLGEIRSDDSISWIVNFLISWIVNPNTNFTLG